MGASKYQRKFTLFKISHNFSQFRWNSLSLLLHSTASGGHDVYSTKELKLQVRLKIIFPSIVGGFVLDEDRTLHGLDFGFLSSFFLWRTFFSKIWVAKLGVRLICECGLFASLYGTPCTICTLEELGFCVGPRGIVIIIKPILIQVYPQKWGWLDLPQQQSLYFPFSRGEWELEREWEFNFLDSWRAFSPNQCSCSPSPLASSTSSLVVLASSCPSL